MGLFLQPLNYNVHTTGAKVDATAPHPLRETAVREVFSPISENALSATHLCPREAESAPALYLPHPKCPPVSQNPYKERIAGRRPGSQCQLLKDTGAGKWGGMNGTALVLTRLIQATVSTKLKGLHSLAHTYL